MEKQTTLINYTAQRERRLNSLKKSGSVAFFLGPYGVCFLLFFVFPLVFGIVMSMSAFDGQSVFPSKFVGLDNFIAVFNNPVLSRDFWGSIWTTLKFALVIVPLSIVIPFFLALLVNTKTPGYKIFRAIIYVPSIFPLTATGLILLRMFDYRNGWINAFFNLSIDWFGETGTAWFMVGLFCLWCGIGGNFIILCAGLENVDRTLYEAADVDGCSKTEKFLHVTLPGIRNQLFIVLFTTFTGYMNLYGQLYILASNTPDQDAMKSAVYRIQDMLMGSSRAYGFAAAMGLLLGLIIIVIAIIQLVLDKEREGGHTHEKAFRSWKNKH